MYDFTNVHRNDCFASTKNENILSFFVLVFERKYYILLHTKVNKWQKAVKYNVL